MNKNVLKMWTNKVDNPSIHFLKYIKGCEWSFNSSSLFFWSIITNPTWQAIGSLQVKLIGKGCKSFTYNTPWTHDLFEVPRSQNDLCQWTIILGEFFFHAFMLLSCVRPWDKPLKLKNYVTINLCVPLIMNIFIRANIHSFGSWTL